MYIERVEIFGFKSFARKTELVFGPGLCVVMGPNGCGKSNILDAIRWAVGEQRMSLLRSATLEDVIFKGSAGLKPLNFAEVSIQLADAQDLLDYDPKADRIKITRRTFRDGESQFLINGASVRLKDIRGILASVGLGDVGYAVIEQVMIDRILGGGVEERRILFEQAAGIAKYKSDKIATEHKLSATQDDLVRLEDILREISEQESILKRQVKRAKQYKNLQEKARRAEISLIAGRLGRYESEKAEIKKLSESIDAEIQKLSVRLAEIGAKTQKIATSKTEMEQKRDAVADERRKIDRKIADAERENAVFMERIENAKKLIASAGETENNINQKIRKSQDEAARLETVIIELKSRRADIENRSEKLNDEHRTLDKSILKTRNELTTIQKNDDKLRERFLELTNRIAFSEAERDKIKKQKSDLEQKIEQNRNEFLEQKIISQKSKAVLDALEEKHLDTSKKIEILRKELSSISEALFDLNAKISKISQRRSELAGRISQIKNTISEGKDIGSGTHYLLTHKDKTRIIGFFADMLHIDEKYSTPAEQIFGEFTKYLVVEKIDDAIDALKILPENSGEIGFIVLSELPAVNDVPKWFSADDERLFALLRSAKIIDKTNPQEFLEFDDSGAIKISQNGCITRRRGEFKVVFGKPGAGALTIRTQLENFQRELNEVETELGKLEAKRKSLDDKKSRLDDELSLLDKELRRATEQHSQREDEYRWASARAEQLEKSMAQLDNQHSELVASIEKIEASIIDWQKNCDKIESSRVELRQKIDKLDEQISKNEAHRRELDEKISANELQRISNEGEIRHAGQDIEREKIVQKDAADEIVELKNNIENAKKSIAEIEKNITEQNKQIQELFSLRDKFERNEYAIREELETINGKLDELRKKERIISEEREKRRAELSEFEKKLSAIDASVEQMRKMALEEIGEIPAPSEPISDEEEMNLQRKLTNYRRRVEQSGAVNLEAEEQYATIKERLDFLLEQKADIVESIGDLKRTIERLDKEAKRLFIQTFEAARENFKNVFLELFDDGEADISLENPDEPLTSDILIKIKPAGKRQLSLSQLSAGEKALTSLALLFGLYLVKPSPFCLMDEVDAPLDDSNVMRFLQLVKKFSADIQFIIVSHNKHTLEHTDYLYGVSMERDGISKVVSIKMSDLKLELE